METGVSYNKQRLHKVGYFGELMSSNADISDAVRPLLNLSRDRSRSRLDHGPDLGSGDRRLHAVYIQQAGYQLLRAVRGREEFG
jgi:hypothetical protein